MSSSTTETRPALAQNVAIHAGDLKVDLVDGRTITVPIAWYPRLSHGTAKERANWRLIARGEGIHWPDLDEDISIDGLLAGSRSGESMHSIKAWLKSRQTKSRR